MRILADAHIGADVLRFLAGEGCDVRSARDLPPATTDEVLLQLAVDAGEVVVTRDADFGTLIFHHGRPAVGVLYVRFATDEHDLLLSRLGDLWPELRRLLPTHFIALTPTRLSARPLP